MSDSNEIVLSDEELTEIVRLARVEREGGDAQYAAFTALCPTGEEGAFDIELCDLYRSLHAHGFVDGESDGEAFYFGALTPEGRAYAEECEMRTAEGSERALWQQGTLEASGVDDSEERDSSAEYASAAAVSGANVKLIAIAAAVGFVAGILGGAIGAYILVAIL